MFTNMSDRYNQEIADLAMWWNKHLADIPAFTITQDQYSQGIHAIQIDPIPALHDIAFNLWLIERNYELSYNQMCNAFFAAATELGKLTVVTNGNGGAALDDNRRPP